MEPGTVIAGKYQVERVLGQGGMGIVVAALHLQLGQRVAIKYLLDSARANPQVVERFLREARAAVRLHSEHVGRVLDVGALATGAPYMVMEYLDGEDLAAMLARSGPLSVQLIADLILQALEAIGEAHALGIVHRDLKPANLFVTRRPDQSPCVKVLDFGIAKATTGVDASLTHTSMIMGSPGYMPPEQLRSTRDADPRSDVWALGVVMYELAAGQRPFSGETITEIALNATLDPPAPLVNVPPGFAAVVNRCLEKEPGRRFQQVGELAAALAPFASRSTGATVRTIGAPTAPLAASGYPIGATPTTLGAVASQLEHAPRARGRRAIAATIFAVLGAVAIALVIAARAGHDRDVGPLSATPPPSPSPSSATVPPPPPPPPRAAPASPVVVAPAPSAASAAATVPPGPPPVAVDAGIAMPPVDAAPVRKVRPRPRPRAGSSTTHPDDVENSRF